MIGLIIKNYQIISKVKVTILKVYFNRCITYDCDECEKSNYWKRWLRSHQTKISITSRTKSLIFCLFSKVLYAVSFFSKGFQFNGIACTLNINFAVICFDSKKISHGSSLCIGYGAICYAFKAAINNDKFTDGTFVIKQYKMSALENIEALKQSPWMQSRKVVQMNSVPEDLALQFSNRCTTANEEFFNLLYNKVFLGNQIKMNLLQLKKSSQLL